ncbi:MAG: esterase/lipase family protein [Myxococcota bacterium]
MRHPNVTHIWVALCLSILVLAGCGSEVAANDPSDASDTRTDIVDTASADAGTDTNTADASDAADTASDTEDPGGPHPIVLAHGMFGFEHLADLEGLDYYFRLEDELRARGDEVLVKEVDPFNDSYVRGEQLLGHIETFVRDGGHQKVNIIAHSQGGLDARYVAHHRPDLVASIVTVSSPHRGTPVADIVVELVENQTFRDLVDALVRLVGKPLFNEVGDKTSLFLPLENFSQEGIERFNTEITDQPGILYASVAGRTANKLGEAACATEHAPPFIEAWNDVGDPVDPFLSVTETIVSEASDEIPNDGLVRVDDAKWGMFLGCVPADHLDEVGQLIGDNPGAGNDWDYLSFYLDLVDWLRMRGH